MKHELPENIDLNNAEFQNVWNLLQHTRQSVFLTGKAGTGKSTFLKYICAHTKKKYVVLAPTGIAAVNVGGQTMHSFFKIPFKPLLPDDPEYSNRQIRKTLRYPKEKIKLIKQLQLIVIDEISMVRADIIDFIDKVLRVYSGNMREPFGGKQLLFVGDVFQLEPVVTRDMREILRRYYDQFFFFNARVFSQLGLVPIELRKIYRQNDSQFISMLDRVRENRATQADIMLLNSRYNPHYEDNGFTMTLATRRDTVNAINDEHMAALKTPEYVFQGTIEGVFPENDLPTSLNLTLKEGAQVIFIRNDMESRWVNGTIARISRLEDDRVWVEMENGVINEVLPETWENIQYSFDEKKNAVQENVLGSFVQFPIKPAWALTVHKSQGLTFNNVVIDFTGGAFTGGQTYVALSRCTSLEGMTLLKPLSDRDIIVNYSVVNFSRRFNDQQAVNDAINLERSSDLYRRAAHAFDNNEFAECVKCFVQAQEIRNEVKSEVVQRLIAIKLSKFKRLNDKIEVLQQVVDAQNKLLKDLANEYCQMGDQIQGYGSLVSEGETKYGMAEHLDDIAFKSAMANYDKALRIYPMCINARIGKGRLYITIDELDRAKVEFQQALELDKASYDAHMALAEIYQKTGRVGEAVKSYKRAVKADKSKAAPHHALADIYEKLGLDDLADEHREIIEQLRKKGSQRKKRKRKKD